VPNTLDISDDVRSALGQAVVARMIESAEYTEVVCWVCGEHVAPEAAETLAVQVLEDPSRNESAVKFSHKACEPSRVLTTVLPRFPLDAPTTFLAVLRRARIPAMLLWEGHMTIFNDPDTGRNSTLDLYLQNGFEFCDPPVLGVHAALGEFVLMAEGDDLVLLDGARRKFECFEDILRTGPQGWLDALKKSRRCLLVTGDLGLDRPSLERIDTALHNKRAAITTARLAKAKSSS
jgi:hypothetical protein